MDDVVVLELARRLRARSAEQYNTFLRLAVKALMAAELLADDDRGDLHGRLVDLTIDSESLYD